MPAPSTTPPPSRLARLGWLVFTLLACAHFSLLYGWRDPQFLDLTMFARGGERIPYQTRILIAWVLRGTAESARLGPVVARIATHLPEAARRPEWDFQRAAVAFRFGNAATDRIPIYIFCENPAFPSGVS